MLMRTWQQCRFGITGCAVAPPSVNGDWLSQWEMAIFNPLQNQHPLTNRQKICHRWLCRQPVQLCQIWCTSALGGLLGKWLKYNLIFFYLYPVFGNSPTDQTRRRIFAHDGSNDADSRKDVPFLDFVDIAPQAKVVTSKNMHIIKTTA